MYDDEEPSQTCAGVKVTLFMKVIVQVFLDSSDIQHEKLSLRLVSPNIPGFSVAPESDQVSVGVKRAGAEEARPESKKKMKK